MQRFFRHLLAPPRAVDRVLSATDLKELSDAVRASESTHRGELRFAVESALDLGPLWRGVSARDRALELFSSLRMWDTEENNGVLIYLLLADRRVEIVADRGVHEQAGAESWSAICRAMELRFRDRDFKGGLLGGLQAISVILARHYPARGSNPDELPNAPVVLS